MTELDYTALAFFICAWLGFSWLTDGRRTFRRESLTRLMNRHRGHWVRNSLNRELRTVDTNIISGLQNGTAFFASASIIAIGGCFALMGVTDQVMQVYRDLPLASTGVRPMFEIKIAGLIFIFGFAFFKFGWSYRLFNYFSMLFGAIPMPSEIDRDRSATEQMVDRAIVMNVLAGRHFNSGLRAIFMSIGFLGWFIGPLVFITTTALVVAVLLRRQFFSNARAVLMDPKQPDVTDVR